MKRSEISLEFTGGYLVGKKWMYTASQSSRPTSERVRKSMFDILRSRMSNCCFADFFSGSGIVGAEAISRNASCVIAVESDMSCVQKMISNITLLKLKSHFVIVPDKVEKVIAHTLEKYRPDVIFLDPPYQYKDFDLIISSMTTESLMKSVVIIEHHHKVKLPDSAGYLVKQRVTRYGETELTFYVEDMGGG